MGLLEHINYEKCPHCGSEITEKKQGSQHCSGKWNEWVSFRCGHRIHFSPNYNAEVVELECRNKPDVKAKMQKRRCSQEKICTYINRIKEVDAEFKKKACEIVNEMYLDF
jgi:hypothetical protein